MALERRPASEGDEVIVSATRAGGDHAVVSAGGHGFVGEDGFEVCCVHGVSLCGWLAPVAWAGFDLSQALSPDMVSSNTHQTVLAPTVRRLRGRWGL